jgi:NAD(P)H-flavin reductase
MVEPAHLRDAEGVPSRIAVIQRVVPETPESSTYWLRFRGRDAEGYAFLPGQFNMLSVFGVGEIAISISSDPAHPEYLAHTIRHVGRVTNAFRRLGPGAEIGVRGPFGRPWPLERAQGGDLVVIAGGVGVCPVRPAIMHAMRHRDRYRRLILLLGARTPRLLMYLEDLDRWLGDMERLGVEVHITVDEDEPGWFHNVGVVTTLFPKAKLEAQLTTAFMCGPEIMMCSAAEGLLEIGVPADRMYVSLERNVQCGMRLCGHCQVGPYFVCADGPVFRWDEVGDLCGVKEL